MSVIATRTFGCDGSDVLLSFHEPTPDGRDWKCEYTITFPDRVQHERAMGVDSVQALFEAMHGAHIKLLKSPEWRRGSLLFFDTQELFLPLPESIGPDGFPKDGSGR